MLNLHLLCCQTWISGPRVPGSSPAHAVSSELHSHTHPSQTSPLIKPLKNLPHLLSAPFSICTSLWDVSCCMTIILLSGFPTDHLLLKNKVLWNTPSVGSPSKPGAFSFHFMLSKMLLPSSPADTQVQWGSVSKSPTWPLMVLYMKYRHSGWWVVLNRFPSSSSQLAFLSP